MGTTKKNIAKEFRLLGSSETTFPSKPTAATLETFPNRFRKRSYWINFDCPEFTSMCPVTGQPDFATIHIRYVPNALCIESKSLKFYLASYRHTRSFNEEIVNRILEDLVAACSPRRTLARRLHKTVPHTGLQLLLLC